MKAGNKFAVMTVTFGLMNGSTRIRGTAFFLISPERFSINRLLSVSVDLIEARM
jgi:hypothetical protein